LLTSGGCKSLTKVSVTSNSFFTKSFYGSENVGAKVYVREGNSPDRQLRSLIPVCEVARQRFSKQLHLGGGLGSSPPFGDFSPSKESVTAH